MEYNTQRKKLAMPEYGRIIQNMVDYAVTIEDKAERQLCANMIISVMGNMFPHLRDVPEFKHKLWDHLAVMSDYRLDIDYPYEITPKSETLTRPQPLAYPMKKIRYRHYGYLLETLMKVLADMPESPAREELTSLTAIQMKRSLANWNKDALDDEKIIADIAAYTHGQIKFDVEQFKKINAEASHQSVSQGRLSMRRNKRKN